MRKFISFLFIVTLFSNFIFSKNFFSSRIYQSKIDIPLSLSNNTFSLNDILVKDLVIDLQKLSENVSDKGSEFISLLNPNISSNINFSKFSIGSEFGIDGYFKVNFSKDWLNLLGKGYSAGDTINLGIDGCIDVYSYLDFPVTFEIGKFKFGITPGIFLPILTFESAYANASFNNDIDGNIKATINTKYNVLVSSGIYSVNKDKEDTIMPFMEIYDNKLPGFDLSASFEFPILKNLNLLVSGSFPIIPGKLNQRMSYMEQCTNFEASVSELIGISNKKNETQDDNKKNDEYYKSGRYWESVGHGLEMEELPQAYMINRPLKLNVYGIYNPFNFLSLTAGSGIVIKHPFDSGDVFVYPEYYCGGIINFFDVLKAAVSTEYTNQIFRHKIACVINLRIIEIDAGISLESSEFLKSFDFYGLGAQVGIILGF